MRSFRVLIFILFLVKTLQGFSQSRPLPAELSAKQIDSLNEKARSISGYNVNDALHILAITDSAAEHSGYRHGKAISYLYQAAIFLQNGDSQRALELFIQSQNLSEKLGDSFNIARAEEQIALLKKPKGNTAEVEQRLQQTIILYRRLGKENEMVNSLNSLGHIQLEKNDFDEALTLFNEALAVSLKNNYTEGIKITYFHFGLVYERKKEFNQAINFLQKSLLINQKDNDLFNVAKCYMELAKISIGTKDLAAAQQQASHAFEAASRIGSLQLQSQAAGIFVKLFKANNNTSGVIEWQDKQISFQQQMSDKEKKNAIGFIDILKDQQSSSLKAQQQVQQRTALLVIAAIIIAVIILLGFPFYRNYKRAKMFSIEVEQKNAIIEKHSQSLDQLNKAISRQNAKLEEENKMKDKLLSIISHDLRHPLVNTKSILDLINLKLVSPKETNELLEQLEAQYIRSLSLLDNLLFWIRGQMKGVKLERTRVNMHQLLNLLIEEQRMPLQNKQIKITNELDKSIDWFAEKEMLKIIFRNLITNAIKFTPSEGTIQLYSVQHDETAYLIVKDSGIGMTKETLEKVNARQYYSSKGTSNEKGSGFGLMLVRDLVIRLNGELMIESEPGRGSTFVIKFPTTMHQGITTIAPTEISGQPPHPA
ncbi:MAG: sensor protein [Chitinophagaceae bacterium]|nr:sensor protein [Chitinophagaceae bacterium]